VAGRQGLSTGDMKGSVRFIRDGRVMGESELTLSPITNRKHYARIEAKGKVVPVLKYYAMKIYWGSGGIAPRILDLSTRWRCVHLHAPGALFPGKEPPAPTG
jgi:hypothetical protein